MVTVREYISLNHYNTPDDYVRFYYLITVLLQHQLQLFLLVAFYDLHGIEFHHSEHLQENKIGCSNKQKYASCNSLR